MNKGKMGWDDVTLKQYLKFQEVIKIEDETERMLAVAELFFGKEVEDLPLTEFVKKMKELDFIKTEFPVKNPPKTVEVNERKYFLDCLLGNIKTAQYVDYTNYAKEGNIAKMLSVFLIPEGHKYNDGYEMEQVFNDIEDLSITTVNNAAFFFVRQLETFIMLFQRSSIKKIQKMKITKAQKKELTEAIHRSTDMVLSHIS